MVRPVNLSVQSTDIEMLNNICYLLTERPCRLRDFHNISEIHTQGQCKSLLLYVFTDEYYELIIISIVFFIKFSLQN